MTLPTYLYYNKFIFNENKHFFKVPADIIDEVYMHMLDTNPEGLDNVMRVRFSNVEKTIQ